MAVTERIERVRELARRLDKLESERAQLDKQINLIVVEMERMMISAPGRTLPVPTSGTSMLVEPTDTVQSSDSVVVTVTKPDAGYSDAALKVVSEIPDIRFPDLALRLYGAADVRSRGRARSVMHFLRTSGKVTRAADGTWKVIKGKV
jgi:hypothetical protein